MARKKKSYGIPCTNVGDGSIEQLSDGSLKIGRLRVSQRLKGKPMTLTLFKGKATMRDAAIELIEPSADQKILSALERIEQLLQQQKYGPIPTYPAPISYPPLVSPQGIPWKITLQQPQVKTEEKSEG